MNSLKRSFVLILWLISSTSAAAPTEGAERIDEAGVGQSLSTGNDKLRVPAQSSKVVNQESVMQRLRLIVDDLKRQGPPPVGCMEG